MGIGEFTFVKVEGREGTEVGCYLGGLEANLR